MESAFESLPAVIADVRRHAVAALHGYAYQIWRSALAWLDLMGEEALDLEGNEDIDHLSVEGAISISIKALKDPVSLRSEDVVETINNFWAARIRNPGLALTLRFLCTAGSAMERGKPFGDRHGLRVWRSVRRVGISAPVADLQMLRVFLSSLPHLDAELRCWLTHSSDALFVAHLISRIDWDLEADGTQSIQQMIDGKLILLGETYGVAATEAVKFRPVLLQKTLQKATDRNNRRLDRVQLLGLFDEATMVSVPRNALAASLSDRLMQSTPTMSTQVVEGGRLIEELRRSSLSPPNGLVSRTVVVGSIRDSLSKNGFVFVTGSTGMGKSTLVLQSLDPRAADIFWLDLRVVEKELPRLLRQVAVFINLQGLRVNLVLDDVNVGAGGDPRPLLDALEMLVAAVRERGGWVIATGPLAPPLDWLDKVGASADDVITAPRFNEAEVDSLLANIGMPSSESRSRWSRLIVAQTSGHPQLVRALATPLKDRGFPDVSVDDLLPDEARVGETKEKARRIVSQLPQADRELLYRLSLTTGKLRRESIFKIGSLAPAVSETGNALDRLTGPWVERVAQNIFRLSPLVQGMGAAVYGEEQVKEMHSGIARSLFVHSMGPDDASAILVHSIAGQDEQSLLHICQALLSADNRKLVYEWLTWFIHYDGAWYGSATRTFVLLVQFAIAAEASPAHVVAAAEKLERETRLRGSPDIGQHAFRFTAVLSILTNQAAKLPFRLYVGLAAEIDALSENRQGLLEVARENSLRTEVLAPINVGEALVALIGAQLSTHQDFKDLLDQLDRQEVAVRDRLISMLGHDPFSANYIVNILWMHEWRAPEPAWLPLLATLQDCLAIALRWRAGALSLAICTVMVRTTNDNLELPGKARELGQTFLASIGRSPELVDAIADTFDAEEEPAEALALRLTVLPEWLPISEADVLGPIIGRRKAAISASKAGQWEVAAILLREASTFPQLKDIVRRVGLQFDAAYADMKAGATEAAIEQFLVAVAALERIPNSIENPTAFRLHKIAGNMLLVMAGGDDARPPGRELLEIAPACCSDFFIHEELKNLPPTPIGLALLNLCRFAVRANAVTPKIVAALQSLRQSRLTVARMLGASTEAAYAVSTSRMDEVASRALAVSQVLVFQREKNLSHDVLWMSDPECSDDRGDQALVKNYLLSALLVQVEGGRPIEVPAIWHDQLGPPALPQEMGIWLENLQDQLSQPLAFRLKRIDSDPEFYELLAMELSVATDSHAAPPFVLRAHWHLVIAAQQMHLLPEVRIQLSRLISRYWARIAENGFDLINPRLTQTPLRDACNLAEEGLRKAAKLTLAANDALGGRIPSPLLQPLRVIGDPD